MPTLIEGNSEATNWVESTLAARAEGNVYDRFSSAVIWSNAKSADGNLLVPVNPALLAAKINAAPFPLLLRHDPGQPMGKVLAAEVFSNPTGEVFVAAIIGLYGNSQKIGFEDLGLNPQVEASPPTKLPNIPTDLQFTLAADFRDIEKETLEKFANKSPIHINIEERSHNASDSTKNLLAISVLFMTLVWNPFVTTFATEASKDAYASLKNWLKNVLIEITKYKNPIVEIQSTHSECRISFMFREKDVNRQYKAHDGLHGAALKAAQLIAQMQNMSLPPVRLIYEFHPKDDIWYPSYAELSDGRLVSDNATLIALETLPSGLSLGIESKGFSD